MKKNIVLLLAAILGCVALDVAPAAAFDYSRFPSPTYKALKAGSLGAVKGTISPDSVAPQAIYGAAFPNVIFSDTLQGVLDVPAGDQNDNRAAVAGYVRTKSAGTGPSGTPGKGNAVALMGVASIVGDNSAAWGVNTLCTDNETRNISGALGKICIGAELDFNIMSPKTIVHGISIGGNSLAQPENASGYLVNTLGNGNKWNVGFWSLDGAAQNAFIAGPLATSGSNVGSQLVLLQYLDVAGGKQSVVLQASGGFLSVSNAPNGLAIGSGDLLLGAGRGVVISGMSVIGPRKTGWAAGTGTPNRGAFDANYTQTMAPTYSQAQVQALQNQVLALAQRVLALETDLRAHGLIGN
ncbi:hypothetical protein [Methylobacterium brachiatum]|uniref:hypothetical protein n=1 Tax=Methylobacterium brachiatum TaxID=269660 RepID=UPI00244C8B77|nr:hypothetical protein [Methylobacterium brachiatum]MDH2313320.1 hypothetical protein [Methylobacterium brachiatum]